MFEKQQVKREKITFSFYSLSKCLYYLTFEMLLALHTFLYEQRQSTETEVKAFFGIFMSDSCTSTRCRTQKSCPKREAQLARYNKMNFFILFVTYKLTFPFCLQLSCGICHNTRVSESHEKRKTAIFLCMFQQFLCFQFQLHYEIKKKIPINRYHFENT